MTRDQGINGLFESLSRNGIEVISMRNKQNRLEQLFIDILHAESGHRAAPMNRWHSYLIAFETIVSKEILRFLRIWMPNRVAGGGDHRPVFPDFRHPDRRAHRSHGGHAYIDFIVPGLVLMAVITNSYANTVSSFYQSKFSHFIEELLIAPVPNWVILAGFISGGIARGLVVGVTVTGVALSFTQVQIYSLGLSLLVFVLTAALFSLGGFINAVYANNFDDIAIVPNFVLMPLTYLGGVFYSIDLLPETWRMLSLVNPVLYMINAFRYGMLGVADVNLALAFGIVIAFIIGLTLYALRLLARGVGIKT